jgi:hypothetical protein
MAEQLFHEFDASDFVNLALSATTSTLGRLALVADMRDCDNNPLAEQLYGKACTSSGLSAEIARANEAAAQRGSADVRSASARRSRRGGKPRCPDPPSGSSRRERCAFQ